MEKPIICKPSIISTTILFYCYVIRLPKVVKKIHILTNDCHIVMTPNEMTIDALFSSTRIADQVSTAAKLKKWVAV